MRERVVCADIFHSLIRPLPIYASKYVFSKSFFSAWVVVSIIWVWGTMFIVGFYPIIDGRKQILQVWRGLVGGSHLNGKGSPTIQASTGVTTPVASEKESSKEVSVERESKDFK